MCAIVAAVKLLKSVFDLRQVLKGEHNPLHSYSRVWVPGFQQCHHSNQQAVTFQYA